MKTRTILAVLLTLALTLTAAASMADAQWAEDNGLGKTETVEELYQAALAMRQTEPGDVLSYMQHWITFQERFNEILPMLPVYSNIYFDFYTSALQNYLIESNVTWGQAIVAATLSEPAPVEEAAEGAEEDGTATFDD